MQEYSKAIRVAVGMGQPFKWCSHCHGSLAPVRSQCSLAGCIDDLAYMELTSPSESLHHLTDIALVPQPHLQTQLLTSTLQSASVRVHTSPIVLQPDPSIDIQSMSRKRRERSSPLYSPMKLTRSLAPKISSDREKQTLQDTAELEMEENEVQGDEDISDEIENIFGSLPANDSDLESEPEYGEDSSGELSD